MFTMRPAADRGGDQSNRYTKYMLLSHLRPVKTISSSSNNNIIASIDVRGVSRAAFAHAIMIWAC